MYLITMHVKIETTHNTNLNKSLLRLLGVIDELGPWRATRLRPSMTDMSLGHCVKYAGKSAGVIPPSATDSESCTYILDSHFFTILQLSIFFLSQTQESAQLTLNYNNGTRVRTGSAQWGRIGERNLSTL